MFEKILFRSSAALIVVTLVVTTAQADVFNMGSSLKSLEWVSVGDRDNAKDGTGYGAVGYDYRIGKYEVTNAQYAEFLSAVATKSDPKGLYNTETAGGWNDIGGITRGGLAGSYSYTVRTNRGDRPVNYVSWYDTLRFANWLHNGQPTGEQGSSTTEDGAYDMSLGSSVVRKPDALVFLPSEDEWYKAAYYKGGGTNAGYWDYPTRSNTIPTAEAPVGTDLVNGSANSNYNDGGYVDSTYYTTEVGAYTAKPSDSPYGTFDQGGNVWEWNETLIDAPRGMRGGGFTTIDFDGYLLASSRYHYLPSSEVMNSGFRVASIPEPGGITLLTCGLLTGLIWWRRRR